jgi:DNA-directed RNA polymerase subunit omega
MNSELTKQALAKIVNPNVLINLVSKRVRQLNASGSMSRPFIQDAAGLGAADIALRDIIEEKLSYDAPVSTEALLEPAPRKRRKSSSS